MAKNGAQTGAGEPPKKKRLTAEEKAAKAQALEAEKRKRMEEREKKQRAKEEAERQKAEQRAARAAEKAKREEEKRQRAEEKERTKREKEEEEARKARSQLKLTSMFAKEQPPSRAQNRAQTDPSGAPADGAAEEMSEYRRMFKPFFVKEHVRLARDPFELDEETREAKARILDEYLLGGRQCPTLRFDPLEALQIPCKVRRGRVYPSVKKLMEELHELTSGASSGLTTESQNIRMCRIMDTLKLVPVKSIKFKEDVRPPYIGTISGLPPGVKSLRGLARKPTSRNVLPLNYDYDSEAEWQDEEGEDVDDLDDEEDEGDMDDDMADFLDDSEDVGLSRPVMDAGMEPQSTGLCWENHQRCNDQPEMHKYGLEFILGKFPQGIAPSQASLANRSAESLQHHGSIDPFSTAYWETPKSKNNAGNDTSSAAAATSATTASGSGASNPGQAPRSTPAVAPSDAFQALNQGPAGTKKSQQPLPPDKQEKLKELVRSMPKLSKVGVIELFASEHQECSKAQIRMSFDALFEKSGKGFKVKGE